jgi:hypothetical protein
MMIRIFDAPLHGERTASGGILLDAGPATRRNLIRGRILEGFRMKTKRPLDWETQCRRAYSSFEKNGFLVPLDLHEDSEIDFTKLVPLAGG